MKNSSKVMYTIGKVFTVISIVVLACLLAFAIVAITRSGDVYAEFIKDGYSKFESAAQVKQFGIMTTVASSIVLVIESVVLALATRAQRSLNNDENATGPHTWMLVIGILGQNIFYFLGGIFGLVTADKQDNAIKKPE